MANYTKIENIDEFNNMVDTFLDTRKELKQKVKEQRQAVIATERIGKKPLTKKQVEAEAILGAFNNYFELFNNYANTTKSSTEIKLTTKPGIGKIGSYGEIDLTDLQDNRLRAYNTKTNENLSREINDSVAELLIKPFSSITLPF